MRLSSATLTFTDNTGRNRIAAIYARQSDTDARETSAGISLSSQSQFSTCIEYCKRNGFAVLAELSEASVDLDTSSFLSQDKRRKVQRTGKRDWQQRPGLMNLYNAAKRGEYGHLVVFDMSRLGGDATELHLIREAFTHVGVTIHLVGEGIRTDQKAGELTFSIFTAVAQKRVEDISRHMAGKALTRIEIAHKAAIQGTGLGKTHCAPPGWVEALPSFAQTPEQVAIEVAARGPKGTRGWFRLKFPAALVSREIVLYRLQGLSYSEICKALNNPDQEGGARTSPQGKRWIVGNLFTALKDDALLRYKGYSVWGADLPEGDKKKIITPGVFPLLFEDAPEANAYGGPVAIIDALKAMQDSYKNTG